MIPEIGILIAAYIVYRCVLDLLHLEGNGKHGKLPIYMQIFIGLLAAVMLLFAGYVASDLNRKSNQAADDLGQVQNRLINPIPQEPIFPPNP